MDNTSSPLGASFNAPSRSPLTDEEKKAFFRHVFDARSSSVDQMLDYFGANLIDAQDDNGNTALILATELGCGTIFDSLLKRGANLDLCNNKGNTALILSVKYGNFESIYKLLYAGADELLKPDGKPSAVEHAHRLGQSGIIEALVDWPATKSELLKLKKEKLEDARDEAKLFLEAARLRILPDIEHFISIYGEAIVNQHSICGDTALMWAAGGNRTDIIDLLLQNGANIEKTNFNGITALMTAAFANNERSVTHLLAHGADIFKQDRNGLTARDHALKYNFYDIADILQHAERTALDTQIRAGTTQAIAAKGKLVLQQRTSKY